MNPAPNVVLDNETSVEDGKNPLNVRIAQGDEHAFAQFVSRFSTPVYRFLVRMVGNSEDAEDLTQETFYALYRHHQNVRTDVELHPYLFTIARRKAISLLRWRKVRHILTPLSPAHETMMQIRETTPADSLEQKQTGILIQQALDRLTPPKRAAVILRYFEGLSYAQIAEVMNKPEGTVKSLVFRGEQDLRRRLAVRLDNRAGES